MRQAEKAVKVFQNRIPLILDLGEKILKKNSKKTQNIKKKLSGIIFSQNEMRQDEIGRERDKRILDSNSAHTRPGGENSEKNSKKILKIKKQPSGAIFSQKGMIQDQIGRERDKIILDPISARTRPGGANFEKKQ